MALSSEQLIANEVLAFLQHAIDTMDEISIIQICKSNFNAEEITSAKTLLYKSVGQIDRMPSRRKDDKGEKSLQDIINLLKTTDPDDVPSFVAKNLNKLPPVTFDHVDVTRLLKDITTLKASLAEVVLKLEASQDTISELRAEVTSLRNSLAVSSSPEVNNINTRRGACKVVSASFMSATPETQQSPASRPAPPPAEVSSVVVTSTPQRHYAAAAARQTPKASNLLRTEKATGSTRNERLPSAALPRQPDEEGFTKVERKKKRSLRHNLCGTAPTEHVLRPAVPVAHVYVSRLHFTTKASDVVEYLEMKMKTRFVVEKLESRNTVNFNSFVVRVPTDRLSAILKEELWPKGVVFRKFRGRRRPPDVTMLASHFAKK